MSMDAKGKKAKEKEAKEKVAKGKVCRACMHSFFIDCQSLRELRITSVWRNAAI
jgi:hypothetical protein